MYVCIHNKYYAICFLYLATLTWSNLTSKLVNTPTPTFVQDGIHLLLTSPDNSTIMAFNETTSNFNIIDGFGTEITLASSTVTAVSADSLYGCVYPQ